MPRNSVFQRLYLLFSLTFSNFYFNGAAYSTYLQRDYFRDPIPNGTPDQSGSRSAAAASSSEPARVQGRRHHSAAAARRTRTSTQALKAGHSIENKDPP